MSDKAETRGRKPIVAGQRMNQRIVTIDDASAELLKRYGGGNLSKGVRKAAELVEQELLSFQDRD